MTEITRPEILTPEEIRQYAKKKMCGGCTGTRHSGSYFSNDCKDNAPDCQRLTDFVYGFESQKELDSPELEKEIAELIASNSPVMFGKNLSWLEQAKQIIALITGAIKGEK